MSAFSISPYQILTVIGGATGIVTAIFHAAMYIGRLSVKVERHEDLLHSHGQRLRNHDEELRFLKGIGQA